MWFSIWPWTRVQWSKFKFFVLIVDIFSRWGGWNCKNRQSGDESNFELFCKFLEFPTDDNDKNTNKNILPDLLDCVDDGVKYKEKKKKHILGSSRVANADLCRTKCSETDGCLYWTWIKKKKKTTCTLISKLKTTGFRRQKNKAVSGTMLKGCNPKGPNKYSHFCFSSHNSLLTFLMQKSC